MNIQIHIQSQSAHITRNNRSESFTNPKEARQFLAEWLEKLNYEGETPLEVEDGQYFDCRDYIVEVEIN